MNELGEGNPGRIPIQEIQSGGGGNKMQSLIATYNYYLQMIRDTTGLNEARSDMPDAKSLVGIQKMAAANSNTATRHILEAGLFITAETAEALSLRISDILEYSPTKNAFIQAIGSHNVATLKEMSELHLYDFGIFIDLAPDEEEKQMLENNIQTALGSGIIDLEDAIDIRDIKNIKLANQVLKIRRKKKQEREQKMQQQNIQAQSKANQEAQAAAAQNEVQKQQALTESQIKLEEAKAGFKASTLDKEAEVKRRLMQYEFELNMQMRGIDQEQAEKKESNKEDRKDQRSKMQASQQSELIDQRSNGKPPKNFESSGNDIISGGIGLGGFDPR
tara:strand:- start:854 stop:1852 length:999 start_codon:yes stop_codon:yes gene_type:complete